MPSRYKLEQLGAKILNELFGVIDNPEEEVSEVEDEIAVPTAATFAQNLQNKINMKTTSKNRDVLPSSKSLKAEMKMYEATGEKGESLKKLELVLKNISPTSIYSEQAFSISASLIPSVRSLLSDEAIDDLCFETGYFANYGYTFV